jgi:hypothetical protein
VLKIDDEYLLLGPLKYILYTKRRKTRRGVELTQFVDSNEKFGQYWALPLPILFVFATDIQYTVYSIQAWIWDTWKPSKKADYGFPGISASFRSKKSKEVLKNI